ncbi:unnamed protein product, partial [Amoebophrya sp. A120]
ERKRSRSSSKIRDRGRSPSNVRPRRPRSPSKIKRDRDAEHDSRAPDKDKDKEKPPSTRDSGKMKSDAAHELLDRETKKGKREREPSKVRYDQEDVEKTKKSLKSSGSLPEENPETKGTKEKAKPAKNKTGLYGKSPGPKGSAAAGAKIAEQDRKKTSPVRAWATTSKPTGSVSDEKGSPQDDDVWEQAASKPKTLPPAKQDTDVGTTPTAMKNDALVAQKAVDRIRADHGDAFPKSDFDPARAALRRDRPTLNELERKKLNVYGVLKIDLVGNHVFVGASAAQQSTFTIAGAQEKFQRSGFLVDLDHMTCSTVRALAVSAADFKEGKEAAMQHFDQLLQSVMHLPQTLEVGVWFKIRSNNSRGFFADAVQYESKVEEGLQAKIAKIYKSYGVAPPTSVVEKTNSAEKEKAFDRTPPPW